MDSTFRAAEIHPRRWAWARKRAAVLDEYLKLTSPSVRDADEAAAKLGVKRRAFYYILDRSSHRPRSHGSARGPLEASASVSRKTIIKRRRFDQARMILAVDERSRIAVDHAPLEIAIRTRQGKAPGYLTVVLDRLNGTILGHFLGLAMPGPASVAASLLDWIGKHDENTGTHIAYLNMHISPDEEWCLLTGILLENGIRRVGRRMSRLPMGSYIFERMDKLGCIPLRPRLAPAKLAARINGLPALDIEEAKAISIEAIQAWNRGRPQVMSPVAPSRLREAIIAQLGVL